MKNQQKVLPYVYICTHRITKEYYIGYRAKNKLPSYLDLPKYKTSSKLVKPNFGEFEWCIVAEFFNDYDAFTHEQHLITECINDPLNINGFVNGNFSMLNRKMSEHTKRQMSVSAKGKVVSDITKQKMSVAQSNRTVEHRAKIGAKHKGKIMSLESRNKMTKAKKGKPSPNKGKKMTDEQKQKISKAHIGKKHPHSEKTKQKISIAHKNIIHTEQHKQRCRTICKDRKWYHDNNGNTYMLYPNDKQIITRQLVHGRK